MLKAKRKSDRMLAHPAASEADSPQRQPSRVQTEPRINQGTLPLRSGKFKTAGILIRGYQS